MDPTKHCPHCGEIVLAVALRCRYCQVDLSQAAFLAAEKQGPRHHPLVVEAAEGPMTAEEFEQRFLEFAYNTDYPIHAPTVAYALKVSIQEATDQLEDLAARDVLLREVDARGSVFFHLPGRNQVRGALPPVSGPGAALVAQGSMVPSYPLQNQWALQRLDAQNGALDAANLNAPTEGTALAALLVNTLCLPGLGSIIGGRSGAGIGQLLLFLIGIPFAFAALIGVPMILSAWIWALVTGIDIMNQAKQAQTQRRQLP